MSYTVLIPARMASSRLPNKPLADIEGVAMVVRVAQRVRGGVPPAVRVVVAGDSAEIIEVCQAHGVAAVLTRSDHVCGSDRLAQACDLLGLGDDEIVVNVQGDEPLIDPDLVAAVADVLQRHSDAAMSTAACAIGSEQEFNNPNVVKVVLDGQGWALYFSRAAIPFWRDGAAFSAASNTPPLRHIGIYGYRAGFLRRFPTLSQAPMERAESLEQLRALWHGYRIAVVVSAKVPGAGVDTPEDLERVRTLFRCAPTSGPV